MVKWEKDECKSMIETFDLKLKKYDFPFYRFVQMTLFKVKYSIMSSSL